MHSQTDIENRLAELESRSSFQELALIELSDALAQVRNESARNAELLKQALGDMRTMRTMLNDDPDVEPPPPHY
ncbi:MAG: SlyX family protein [Arenimonas sp.]|nr:SlyX family protein [Arenimonas sp.]